MYQPLLLFYLLVLKSWGGFSSLKWKRTFVKCRLLQIIVKNLCTVQSQGIFFTVKLLLAGVTFFFSCFVSEHLFQYKAESLKLWRNISEMYVIKCWHMCVHTSFSLASPHQVDVSVDCITLFFFSLSVNWSTGWKWGVY